MRKITNQLRLSVIVLSCLMPVASMAAVLEEIVVTAQKREQNVQDVGISMTAMSGSQLEDLQLDNMMEIAQQIPGLQLQTYTHAAIPVPIPFEIGFRCDVYLVKS